MPDEPQLLIQIEHYLDPDPKKPTAYANFLARMGHLHAEVLAGQWATVVLDSVTSHSLAARKMSQYATTKGREPRRWHADATDSVEEQLQMRLGALPCNVVLIAHTEDKKDTEGASKLYFPAAPGRMARGLPSGYETYRSFAFRQEDGSIAYALQTQNDGLFVACSCQVHPPNPCWPEYEALWEGFPEGRPRPWLHVLNYGDTGTQKSTFAATFPTPMLVLMFDNWGKEGPYLRRGEPGPIDTTVAVPVQGVFSA